MEVRETAETGKSVFPISRDIAIGVVSADKGQDDSIRNASLFMGFENPGLSKYLRLVQRILNPLKPPKAFVDGALWTYEIARTQARQRGIEVPQVEEGLISVYIDDERKAARASGQGFLEFLSNGAQKLREEEHQLADALEQAFRGKSGKDQKFMWAGAASAYNLLRMTSGVEERRKKLWG